MYSDRLTKDERELAQRLPKPPAVGSVRTTNVWIVEWLPEHEDDPRTGLRLHEWMETRLPGWSAYKRCETKHEVISAIDRAKSRAQKSDVIPILHLEAHGADFGLMGPDGTGGEEVLGWDELIEPLQRLNLATRCNLILVVAACIGFSGIKALTRGPRAPAVALIGPSAAVSPSKLLLGTKEFYRRWQDKSPRLHEIAESASQEAGTVDFVVEPFVALTYEAFVEELIVSMRPEATSISVDRIRQTMLSTNGGSTDDIESRLAQLPRVLPDLWQQIWDEMFMIDLYPENRERFGLDMRALVNLVAGKTFPSVNA